MHLYIKHWCSRVFCSFNSESFTQKIRAIISISHVGAPPLQWNEGLYVHLMDWTESKTWVSSVAKEDNESFLGECLLGEFQHGVGRASELPWELWASTTSAHARQTLNGSSWKTDLSCFTNWTSSLLKSDRQTCNSEPEFLWISREIHLSAICW